MVKAERLEEVAIQQEVWLESAQGIITSNWDLDDEIATGAARLARQIVGRSICLEDLRAGVSWANALDRESVETYGSDLIEGDQLIERVARRVMHGAGRKALDLVKTEKKRIGFSACNRM